MYVDYLATVLVNVQRKMKSRNALTSPNRDVFSSSGRQWQRDEHPKKFLLDRGVIYEGEDGLRGWT